MDPRLRFLMALSSAIRNGAVKTIKQAMAFAEQQFGKIDKSFVDDIVKVFKKEGKTKKGDVVPIKKKKETLSEADKDIADIQKSIDDLAAAEAEADAFSALDKRTKDIAKGDVTGETSDLMKDVEKKVESIKKQADELKKVADEPKPFMEIAEGPEKGKKITVDDFLNMTGAARDPRRGVVRAAAREILNKNKVKIGSEDPINVLRQMYGEKGLEAIDAVSDGLLDVQSYGEMNTILKNNKLFDLVPKKTYGYDQSVVSAEKIRKAKEQEAKNLKILEDWKPDREPSAYGGIAGQLHLNRTGYFAGKLVKGWEVAKKIKNLLKDKKKLKAAWDDIFPTDDYKYDANMVAESLVENNPKVFGNRLYDDLTDAERSEVYGAALTEASTNFAKTLQMKRAMRQASKPTKTLEGIEKTGTINISDPNVADEFSRFMKETDPKGFKDLEQKVELSNFNPKGRKKNAGGGIIGLTNNPMTASNKAGVETLFERR